MSKMTTTRLKLLGTKSDNQLAAEWDMHSITVFRWRQKLGIPAFYPSYQWTPETTALLGTQADFKIAELLGIPETTVSYQRTKLGIKAFNPASWKFNWTPEALSLLGSIPDEEAALQLGLSRTTIRVKRVELGIPALSPKISGRPRRTYPLTEEMIASLGKISDRELSRLHNIPFYAFAQARKILGIPAFKILPGTKLWKRRGEAHYSAMTKVFQKRAKKS